MVSISFPSTHHKLDRVIYGADLAEASIRWFSSPVIARFRNSRAARIVSSKGVDLRPQRAKVRSRVDSGMRGVETYAIAAASVTLAATLWAMRARKVRGPSRGFGAVYAALLITGVWGASFLHGLVVAIVALATGPTRIGWACAGMHAAVLLLALRK